ncbi:MAG TPA: hypothetical protein VJ508_05500 [Saprospiraceae bacterium]|nr:hypothetical protein [Saprospiraceae bacterium]
MVPALIDQLASSLGQRDEMPNINLAIKIAKSDNAAQVEELIGLMGHKKAAVYNDVIKVLYEIGERKPELIAPYLKHFLAVLHHKDNRMRWGAMNALSAISHFKPELLAPHLVAVVDAMDSGTVITRDHGIYILCDVARIKKHRAGCMELLLEQIEKAPVNQVPMYAEKTAAVMSSGYIDRLIRILEKRQDVLEIPSKAKRIFKVIKQLKAVAN